MKINKICITDTYTYFINFYKKFLKISAGFHIFIAKKESNKLYYIQVYLYIYIILVIFDFIKAKILNYSY